MKHFLYLFLFLLSFQNFAQEARQDTTLLLNEAIVKGLESFRTNLNTSVAVSQIKSRDIERFDNTSLVSAFNINPGVRMEERSPGSYRIAIRGSSIRSPFGVRNVKVYWNDIPLTDANGITYFNLMDMNTLGSIEVIKGPSASIYGAGIGGVILLQSKNARTAETDNSRRTVSTNWLLGSYGTQNRSLSYSTATEKVNAVISYAHSQTDGYRDNSAMVRDVFNYRSSFFISDKNTLNVNAFYSDHNYQTPGGLTKEQMEANPRGSRPKTPATPSAIDQKARIFQKLFNLGLSQQYQWNKNWSNTTSLFSSFSILKNPFITNYEVRNEQSLGGRNITSYSFAGTSLSGNLKIGAEAIRTTSKFDNYDNNQGVPGKRQTEEEISSVQASLFSQLELVLPHDIIFTLGGSLNSQSINYLNLTKAPDLVKINDNPAVPFSPRIAVLKNFNNQFTLFGSYSLGFSSPTVQEFSATYQYSPGLKVMAAEKGRNLEFGIKTELADKRIKAEISAYALQLSNTIVRRLNDGGLEYFVNAGNTAQNGLEFSSEFAIIKPQSNLFIKEINLRAAYTLNDYTYKNYTQTATDLSGKLLPGIAKHSAAFVLDVIQKHGFFLHLMSNLSGKIALNDANTFYADPYQLINGRIGFHKKIKHVEGKIFAGFDNLLDQTYSLGNDTNAFGNRFYNIAPDRTFNSGVSLSYHF